MPTTIFQIDAFTDRPFAGNPAAVCLLDAPVDEGWMQDVAREMALSETAFLVKQEDGFDLRWFTPLVEVSLCGHATLASAHFLWEQAHLSPNEPARFHTLSGLLSCRKRGAEIEMDFPSTPPVPAEPPGDLLRALGVEPRFTGRSSVGDYLVDVGSESVVRGLRPDMTLLASVSDAGGVRGVIVTARSDSPDYDFVSRFFAPAAGIPEDPVTGSAHCTLAPYWHAKMGKAQMVGYQASARGGVVGVTDAGERVLLRGRAVTVLKAELYA
jgi:PhzF family phenazine biosynthesis protein